MGKEKDEATRELERKGREDRRKKRESEEKARKERGADGLEAAVTAGSLGSESRKRGSSVATDGEEESSVKKARQRGIHVEQRESSSYSSSGCDSGQGTTEDEVRLSASTEAEGAVRLRDRTRGICILHCDHLIN